MRLLFKIIALLDFLSLIFLGMQLWEIGKHFAEMTLLAEKISGALMFPMFVLVLLGAIAHISFKKIGFILYYIQFPFRLYLWIFTLGFITLVPEAVGSYDDRWYPVLLKVCFAGEVIRLFFAIKAHRSIK
jgi:hypothetical protein